MFDVQVLNGKSYKTVATRERIEGAFDALSANARANTPRNGRLTLRLRKNGKVMRKYVYTVSERGALRSETV